MNPVRNILAPIDLAVDSGARVRHAVDLAAGLAADLTLLYVIDDTRPQPSRRLEWPESALYYADRRIRRVVQSGPIVETICEFADRPEFDLVALTTSHSGGWKRFFKKSSAPGIVGSIRKPVCLIRPGSIPEATPFRCERIVCLVALDGKDDGALLHSEALARHYGAEVMLLHAVPDASEALLAYGLPGAEDRPLSRRVALLRIRELAAGLRVPNITVVMNGSPDKAIARSAERYRPSLLVCARSPQGVSRPDDLDLGSVLKDLSCPLISTPAAAPKWRTAKENAPVECFALQ